MASNADLVASSPLKRTSQFLYRKLRAGMRVVAKRAVRARTDEVVLLCASPVGALGHTVVFQKSAIIFIPFVCACTQIFVILSCRRIFCRGFTKKWQ